jgi:hypothetical protein
MEPVVPFIVRPAGSWGATAKDGVHEKYSKENASVGVIVSPILAVTDSGPPAIDGGGDDTPTETVAVADSEPQEAVTV